MPVDLNALTFISGKNCQANALGVNSAKTKSSLQATAVAACSAVKQYSRLHHNTHFRKKQKRLNRL